MRAALHGRGRGLLGLLVPLSLLPGCRERGAGSGAPRLLPFSPALVRMAFDLGFGEQVVGVAAFSTLPPGVERPVVGDTVRFDSEAILALRPDVLLVQTADLDRFAPLLELDPELRLEPFELDTLADVERALPRLAGLAGDRARGERAARDFRRRLEAVRERASGLPRPRALFLVGLDRPAAAGEGTFLDELLRLAGAVNAAGVRGWRQLEIEEVLAARPEHLLVWVEPEQAERARARWDSLEGLPEPQVMSGPDWLLPTDRLADCAEDLFTLLHPELEGRP